MDDTIFPNSIIYLNYMAYYITLQQWVHMTLINVLHTAMH